MEEELLKTLGDFTNRENWDKFFTIKGSNDPFEWYSEWPEVSGLLLHELRSLSPASSDGCGTGDCSGSAAAPDATACRILVPGCGNSRLSEGLYDAGFRDITNIDFSRIVISDMLRLHIRSRPIMRWRVMDMTDLQFADGSFDAVVDKGGLDALMEPEHGPELGNQYLSEVKRVLTLGGKFICLTLAESHVVELLFSKFRFGWKIDVKPVTLEASGNHGFQTFLLVATREKSSTLDLIIHGLLQAVDAENKIRSESLQGGVDIVYSLEDLKLGAGGDLEQLIFGRRLHLILGGKKLSRFSYKAVVLDSKEAPDPLMYQCAIFLVPKIRAHEWLFSSEEGQWLVVENAKAARLIMVFLDSEHSLVGMDDIQKDLSPLVKTLAPGKLDNGTQIPFMMANDGVKHRNIVHEVTSTMTGEIIVEDVVYEETEAHHGDHTVSKDSIFRRLIFKRSLGLVQSEVLLISKDTAEKTLNPGRSKSSGQIKKKSSQKGSRASLEVDHSYLANSYHRAIISGFLLIASNMEHLVATGEKIRTTIIGLGGGLLPMFLRRYIPVLDIEVIELDPVIFNVARDYFGFTEDNQMKVQIGDGVQFVSEIAHACRPELVDGEPRSQTTTGRMKIVSSKDGKHDAANRNKSKIDILIIDADSADLSTGLTCPPANFVEESFLATVKESLSDVGLFIINTVSQSPSVREKIVQRIQEVFAHIFCLKIEEDVNEVLFALGADQCVKDFPDSTIQFQNLFTLGQPHISAFIETAKMIKRLN
ncbi:Methyltransferase-like protein 13 [Nymphaea thermarum]|nr:Methyltransferase-like protein 13 [Nymphaea thermarum]